MARRRFQKGQLKLVGDKWIGRWREDVIEQGVVRRIRRKVLLGTTKDYPTKRLARRALDEQLVSINRLDYRPMPTAKFSDFAVKWTNEVLTQFGESTAINYRTHVKKHLVPFFGGCALRDITPELVQRFVSASSVGPKTTANICITLQSLWRTAKAWGYVTLPNIMESVVLPPVKRVQRFFFSGAELGRILETALEPYRTFYGLLAETGMRVGELCGLTLDDLDLERGMLQVQQSAWRGKLGEPKTEDSIRVVEISPQACEHLRGYLHAWRPNERRLLFATSKGTPWNQDMVLKRNLRPLCRKLDIRLPRGNGFHAFRHANATLMNSFGASLKLRQERLGHAQGSRVTETIYTHVISEDARRIAAQLGEAVWGRILDPGWTQEAKRPSVESAKPFQIN